MAILVAYDGSAPAQQAVEYAVREHPDEELILLRVVELADSYTDASISLFQETLKERRKEAATELSEDVLELLDPETVAFETETVVGDPAREIVAYAEEHDIDHVIVGSHGRKGVSRVLLGSVAEKLVRRTPVPVTVVR